MQTVFRGIIRNLWWHSRQYSESKASVNLYVNAVFKEFVLSYVVSPLYNDIRYNSKIRYNVNPICTKIRGSCIFSLTVPWYSMGKHTFLIFIRIASPRRFFQIH